MLELFKFRNYLSFKNESVLDLRASAYKQHSPHVFQGKNEYLDAKYGVLKTVAIYGANASGKSNVIAALYSMRMFILSQLFQKTDTDKMKNSSFYVIEPFRLSTDDNSIEFEIVFSNFGSRIQYGFELEKCESADNDFSDESTNYIILSEWYDIDGDNVFERNRTDVKFGSKYQKALREYTKLPSDRLYISVLDYFLEDSLKDEIIGAFIDFFKNKFNVFADVFLDVPVKKMGSFAVLSGRLFSDDDFRKKVVQYLRQIDVGITDLVVVEDQILDGMTTKKRKRIKTVHKVYDEKRKESGNMAFDLSQESTGTLRFLNYIQRIIEIQENSGVFVVDELSSKLHPLITKFIIDMFQSSNNNNSQLVFTTHDIFHLSKEQFRRDEVVFVNKNEYGESTLYSLADLKIREDSTFSKDYILGKYGAIPIFKDILDEEE